MFQESVYTNRVKKLRKIIDVNALYLFSSPNQIAYLTGFQFLVPSEREAFLVVVKEAAILIYTSFAPLTRFDFLTYLAGTFPAQLKEHLEKIVDETKIHKLFYDPQTLFVSELHSVEKVAGLQAESLQHNLVGQLMMNKENREINQIKKACKITHSVFETIKPLINSGMTELEVCELIEDEFKKSGVKELAFPTIVAFGANSAKPHHQPGNAKLEDDMVVLLDFGAKCEGYCADMTRTFWFGSHPSEDFNKIETIILKASELATQVLSIPAKYPPTAKDVDNAARTHISNQGFGDNFFHTTGHGLGLDIHEQPSVSWKNTQQLLPNLTITIEPGIYIKGNFGYRHENTVCIKPKHFEILTKSDKL